MWFSGISPVLKTNVQTPIEINDAQLNLRWVEITVCDPIGVTSTGQDDVSVWNAPDFP